MTDHTHCAYRHSIVNGCGAPDCPVKARWDEGVARYVAAREQAIAEHPEGWRHADCDHAEGICQG